VKMLDRQSRPIGRGAASLLNLARIDAAAVPDRLSGIELVIGCDVDNPLYGPRGAAYIYAPQKGAAPEELPFLDECLRRFAAVVKKDLAQDISQLPGGGAAGGIGAGLAALGGKLVPGIEKIMEIAGLSRLLAAGGVDLVITGEGEINSQSLRGKVPVGVARLAKYYGVPVLVLAGSVKLGLAEARREGITTMLSITDGPLSLAEAMRRTAELLENTAQGAALLLEVGGWM
ncbi:MAG: glycerate kinase, partial [Bacillota bacterium]